MANPMPLPFDLVVKKAEKILSTFPAGSPGPVSVTENNSCRSCSSCDSAVSSPPSSCMASMALSMRFMNTCCSWHTVYHHFGQVGGEFRAHGNRVSIGLTFQQREHFLDNSVHVDQFTLWRRLLVKGSYAVDDFRRTIPILIDSGCCRTGLIPIGSLVGLSPRRLSPV